MNIKMPQAMRKKIQNIASAHKWSVKEKSPGTDEYVKLITLNSSVNRRCIFIDKVTGFSASGNLLYFKVALKPEHYEESLEALPGISAAINRQTGNNLHSHSGYSGCPVISPHDEPCAKAYRVENLDALENLLIRLNS